MNTHKEVKERLMNINIKSFTIDDLNYFSNYIVDCETKEKKLQEIEGKLPNLLKLAIEMGHGIEHTGNVDKQENQIVNEILKKVGR